MASVGNYKVTEIKDAASLFLATIDDNLDYTWMCPYCLSINSYMHFPTEYNNSEVSAFDNDQESSHPTEQIITHCHYCRKETTLISSLKCKNELQSTVSIEEAFKDISEEEDCSYIAECKKIKYLTKNSPTTPITTYGDITHQIINLTKCTSKPTQHKCIFTKQERVGILLKEANGAKVWLKDDVNVKFRNFYEMHIFLDKFAVSLKEYKIPYILKSGPSVLAPFLFNEESWELCFEFYKGVMYLSINSIPIEEETPNHVYFKNVISIWKKFMQSLADKATNSLYD